MPIREGDCKVDGYTPKSPNARLVLVDLTEQYKQEQDAEAIYEDESDPNWSAGFIYHDDPVKKMPQAIGSIGATHKAAPIDASGI